MTSAVAASVRREARQTGGAPPSRVIGVALVGLVVLGGALRLWAAGRHALNLDESFTASIGRRPVGEILAFLRAHDTHPPLDYLLRAPLGRAGAGDLEERLPSVVWSTASLACLAWWLRRRGWLAVLAIGLMAVSAFQVLYGYEARMYSLLGLLGVVAAMLTDGWLARPTAVRVVGIGVVALLAVFDHVSGLFLAAGLLTVPGVRTDRAAWWWRLGVAVPVVVYATLWGPALLEQRHHDHAPAPATTLASVAGAVSAQVTTLGGVAALVLVAAVMGFVALRTEAPPVFRAALSCAVAPFALAALVGVVSPLLMPRFLMAFGWAVAVALAAGVVWVGRRMRLVAVAVAVVLAIVVLASTVRELTLTWPVDRAVARLQAVVEPGDVVATSPAWYAAILDWHVGVHGPGGGDHPVVIAGLDDTYAFVVGDAPRTGRVWLLRPADGSAALAAPACARPWNDGVARIDCLGS